MNLAINQIISDGTTMFVQLLNNFNQTIKFWAIQAYLIETIIIVEIDNSNNNFCSYLHQNFQ
jgi:hypothetical protein